MINTSHEIDRNLLKKEKFELVVVQHLDNVNIVMPASLLT
jgi:hypothetical protein